MATSPDARQSTQTRRPGGRRGPRPYAALDLGTNNCRLLVAAPSNSGRLRILDSHSQVVRLGEGLAQSGRLSEAAMDRAIEALKACAEKAKRHRPIRARYITTQACRAASNGQEFLQRVRQQVGLKLEAITPKQEAKYALMGSLDLIDPTVDFAAVVDIGGGSTEVCFVDARAARARGIEGCAVRPPILGWASFPFGVVTLTEGFADTTASAYENMVEHVKAGMMADDVASRFGPLFAAKRGQLIGNSGTVTSLTAVSMNLPKYSRSAVDGAWLTEVDARAACQRLVKATRVERSAEPCIGSDRADLIVAGCAILDAVWSLWPTERMRVGDRGLREGMLLSMIHGPKKQSSDAPNARSSRKPKATTP